MVEFYLNVRFEMDAGSAGARQEETKEKLLGAIKHYLTLMSLGLLMLEEQLGFCWLKCAKGP